MTVDQVRQASKVLGPLLRRRGKSPALGASLRRGLQAIDKVFSGLSAQAQDEAIADGIAELRNCVELVGQSDRPADHDQLPGIEKALAVLAPPENAVPAAPMPDLLLAATAENQAAQARTSPRPAAAPARAPARPPVLDFGKVGPLLCGYEAKLHTLHIVASEPLFTAADLDGARADLDKQISALRWLGRERIPEILRVADAAKGLSDRMVAGAALVHLGDARGAEMVIDLLGKAAADKQPLPDSSQTLLRTLVDQDVGPWLLKVFQLPAHPTVCGLLLPVLAEHNLLSAEQLWQSTGHAKDEIAVEAARALPWAKGGDAGLLLGEARKARTRQRANAILFAATVLGSDAALAEARARVRADDADVSLVDALALAGDAGDAELLIRLALESDDGAENLLLAAAHLGSAATLKVLPALQDLVSARVLAEARRLIAGDSAEAGPDAADVRLLGGQPWSVASVLDRLKLPSEPLQAQRRMALELRARTGQAPPSTLPLLLSAASRSDLMSSWVSYYAKPSGRLKPGQWYYQGKIVNPASKEMPA